MQKKVSDIVENKEAILSQLQDEEINQVIKESSHSKPKDTKANHLPKNNNPNVESTMNSAEVVNEPQIISNEQKNKVKAKPKKQRKKYQ